MMSPVAGLLLLCLVACADKSINDTRQSTAHAVDVLRADYDQLPEQLISVSADSSTFAQYALPTTRYRHGILGDAVEAGQLVVVQDGVSASLTLDVEYVFEDLAPRLVDVDGDGQVEVITIRTHVDRGAGIAIYKIQTDGLHEYAWVAEIGRSSRWLNIAAVYDLDGDGTVELAWVQTPHIGGILRVAHIEVGELTVVAEASQYSNHAIGERNLQLSVVTRDDDTTLWLPTQDRSAIAGFQFSNDSLVHAGTIEQSVDFSSPLDLQYDFAGVLQTGGGL